MNQAQKQDFDVYLAILVRTAAHVLFMEMQNEAMNAVDDGDTMPYRGGWAAVDQATSEQVREGIAALPEYVRDIVTAGERDDEDREGAAQCTPKAIWHALGRDDAWNVLRRAGIKAV